MNSKTITVTTEKQVTVEGYYVLRGISEDADGRKKVIAEKEFLSLPTWEDYGQFLIETGADFCSLATNYRLNSMDIDIPFTDESED